jgi:hypothetical protein
VANPSRRKTKQIMAEESTQPRCWVFLSFINSKGFLGAAIVQAHGKHTAIQRTRELGICPLGKGANVPGRQPQWFWRRFLRVALLDAVAGRILRVVRAPVGLRLFPPRRLTLRLAARVLTVAYTRIGPEPPTTDRTRSLPGRGHGSFIIATPLAFAPSEVQFMLPGSVFPRAEVPII